jgi:glycine hydroxymethyltransferase
MIFFRKEKKLPDGKVIKYDYENKINTSVFPGFQGGPHNHTIAALAVALKLANTTEFVEYQTQVLKNSKRIANGLINLGYKLVSNGTDNHLMLVDLKPNNVDGAKVERICELSNIALNKNTVPGDKSALSPGGIRLGTPAVTTR